MEENKMVLRLMRVREGAVIPKQATAGSAEYDLCACIEAPVTIAIFFIFIPPFFYYNKYIICFSPEVRI